MSLYSLDMAVTALPIPIPSAVPRAGIFDRAPFIVIWEVTRACGLTCHHCRAEAETTAHPDELSTAEGLALLSHLRIEFGPVLFVFTGGDPLERADIFALAKHGADIGLHMAITPSATPLLTTATIARMNEAGIRRMAISLDSSERAVHDEFRGVTGTFDRAITALHTARDLGMEVQVNTTVGPHNRHQVRDMARMCDFLGAKLWSVFQMVPTGRATREMVVTAAEHERIYRDLADIALDPATSFDLKTTAGQPYYRVLAQERARRGGDRPDLADGKRLRAPGAVNDGKGFVFISRTGDISPSGFLPLVCGNVRRDSLAEVYRTHPTFVRLRRPETYTGKCGVCEFNQICGGSRSRTYNLSGDAFGWDPTCVYQPKR